MRTQTRWVLIILLLILCGGGLAFWVANGTNYFVGAYRPMVERARQNAQDSAADNNDDTGTPTSQPQPVGLKESEIKKQHGDGYATY